MKPTVSGVFKGNGKEAKLAHVSAHWREPFSDKPSFVLVFTEKDHSKDKKPDFKASFGDSAVAHRLAARRGGHLGCQVVHTAHEKQGFSSVGSIKTDKFKFADGKVEGELATDGKEETFGETGRSKSSSSCLWAKSPRSFNPPNRKSPNPATHRPKPAPVTVACI